MSVPTYSVATDIKPANGPNSTPLESLGSGSEDTYIQWLRAQRERLILSRGTAWRRYFGYPALVPASTKPMPVHLGRTEALQLLRQSGTHFVRYFSRTFSEPTDFWYVACDRYDFDGLPTKMKTKIRRSYKDCTVRPIEPTWLADNGYECYAAAYDRYKNGLADSRELFVRKCLSCGSGPFEFRGAFIEEKLVGFAKMIVGVDYVTMSAFKIHPGYPSARPAYALMDSVLREYVGSAQKQVNNGFRSLNHDTNMQDFLLQFGFQKVYCDLQIVYRPLLGFCMGLLYPLRGAINRIPSAPVVSSVKILLRQEEIRRSFLGGSAPPTQHDGVGAVPPS